jgi:hypothetical protein
VIDFGTQKRLTVMAQELDQKTHAQIAASVHSVTVSALRIGTMNFCAVRQYAPGRCFPM